MLQIVVEVNAPLHHAQGIKEDLCTYLERFGDTRVLSVTEAPRIRAGQVQMEMDEWRTLERAYGVRP
ncbi:MAG: hypothetical protein IJT94_00435 [Oscillibacter sp.]|nr:hypothetical protein [Oscillibacter sp.]